MNPRNILHHISSFMLAFALVPLAHSHEIRNTKLDDRIIDARLNDDVIHYGTGWIVQADGSIHHSGLEQMGEWVGRLNLGYVYADHPQVVQRSAKKVSIHLTSTTVREVLDALTSADTSYSWVQDGEVVNFIPRGKSKKESRMVEIMNRKVPRFVIKELFLSEALHELRRQINAQGIAEIVLEPKMRESYERGLLKMPNADPVTLITVAINNKSIRECMNVLISKHSSSYWFAFPHKGKIFLTGKTNHGHGTYGIPKEELKNHIKRIRELEALLEKKRSGALTPEEEENFEREMKKVKEFKDKYPVPKIEK